MTFDLRTGAEAILDVSFAAPQETEAAYNSQAAGNGPSNVVPFNFSGPAPVGDPTDPFFRVHGRVFTFEELPNGLSGLAATCSGTLISPFHVLTASHCVFTDAGRAPGDYGWPSKVVFAPAASRGAAPYGQADGILIHTFTGWVQDQDLTHDVAIVTLARPVGLLTGWRIVGTHPKCAFWESPQWSLVGYPLDPDNPTLDGATMVRESGSFDDCSDLPAMVRFDAPTLQGLSGAGAVKTIVDDSGSYIVVWGVMSASVPDTGPSLLARLDEFEYRTALLAFDRTTPVAADLVPLNVTTSRKGLHRGEALEEVSVLVGNIGKTTFSGPVDLLLTRSLADAPAGSGTTLKGREVNLELPRNATTRVTFDSVVPFGPGNDPGHYVLGVRLLVGDANDANDETGEFDRAPIRLLHRFEFPIEDLLHGLKIRP